MAEVDPKLSTYLALAKTAKGAQLAKLIESATQAPGLYVFGELLDETTVRELESDPEHSKYLQLLKLFAYGTIQTYTSQPDAFPPLSSAQINKLKHLTVVSLASQSRALEYAALSSALQLGSIRELEDLIIDVIYAGLLGGKLHHHEKVLHVDWVAGRDVAPNDLPRLAQRLQNWTATSSALLGALDNQIATLRSAASKQKAYQAEYESYRDQQYQLAAEEEASQRKRGGIGMAPDQGGGSGGELRSSNANPHPGLKTGTRSSKRFKSDELE